MNVGRLAVHAALQEDRATRPQSFVELDELLMNFAEIVNEYIFFIFGVDIYLLFLLLHKYVSGMWIVYVFTKEN
jgi:hypothetical protein